MGFSRRAPGATTIATEAGDDHEMMASGILPHAPSPTGSDSHIGASTGLRTAPSTAGQDSLIEALASLGIAPSRRIRQPLLPHVTTAPTSIAIAERFSTTTVINFQAIAEQMDAVIKSN